MKVAGNYRPHPRQREFHDLKARFKCASAGVRGGKSTAAAVDFVVGIYEDIAAGIGDMPSGIGRLRRPRIHAWIVAPTFALLKESFKYVFDIVPSDMIVSFTSNDHSLWLVGDVLIEGKSADSPRNLVGAGLHRLWIDEAARVHQDAWEGSLRSRLSDKNGKAVLSTSPYGGQGNWVHRLIIEMAATHPAEYGHVAWPTSDNPKITPEELESARAGMSPKFYARDYLASWSSFAGLVYDEWEESKHVVTLEQLKRECGLHPNASQADLRRTLKYTLGAWDFGWQDPTVLLVMAETPHGIVVVEEKYASGRFYFDPRVSTGTWCADAIEMREKWGIQRFVGDPSAALPRAEFSRVGIHVEGAQNDLIYGIRRVAELMHPHPTNGGVRFRVLDTCSNFRREVSRYVWQQAKDGVNFMEMPSDADNHALDAARYGVLSLRYYENQSHAQAPASSNWGIPSRGPLR